MDGRSLGGQPQARHPRDQSLRSALSFFALCTLHFALCTLHFAREKSRAIVPGSFQCACVFRGALIPIDVVEVAVFVHRDATAVVSAEATFATGAGAADADSATAVSRRAAVAAGAIAI